MIKNKFKGFTLSEVIVTMLVIAVVVGVSIKAVKTKLDMVVQYTYYSSYETLKEVSRALISEYNAENNIYAIPEDMVQKPKNNILYRFKEDMHFASIPFVETVKFVFGSKSTSKSVKAAGDCSNCSYTRCAEAWLDNTYDYFYGQNGENIELDPGYLAYDLCLQDSGCYVGGELCDDNGTLLSDDSTSYYLNSEKSIFFVSEIPLLVLLIDDNNDKPYDSYKTACYTKCLEDPDKCLYSSYSLYYCYDGLDYLFNNYVEDNYIQANDEDTFMSYCPWSGAEEYAGCVDAYRAKQAYDAWLVDKCGGSSTNCPCGNGTKGCTVNFYKYLAENKDGNSYSDYAGSKYNETLAEIRRITSTMYGSFLEDTVFKKTSSESGIWEYVDIQTKLSELCNSVYPGTFAYWSTNEWYMGDIASSSSVNVNLSGPHWVCAANLAGKNVPVTPDPEPEEPEDPEMSCTPNSTNSLSGVCQKCSADGMFWENMSTNCPNGQHWDIGSCACIADTVEEEPETYCTPGYKETGSCKKCNADGTAFDIEPNRDCFEGTYFNEATCNCQSSGAHIPMQNFCPVFAEHTNTLTGFTECNGDAISVDFDVAKNTDFNSATPDLILRNGIRLFNLSQEPQYISVLDNNTDTGGYVKEDNTEIKFNEWGYTVYVDIDAVNSGANQLWQDVFPFYIMLSGRVIPAYTTIDSEDFGANNRMYMQMSVEHEDITTGVRQKKWLKKSVSYKEAACAAGYVGNSTSYCGTSTVLSECSDATRSTCRMWAVKPVKLFF